MGTQIFGYKCAAVGAIVVSLTAVSCDRRDAKPAQPRHSVIVVTIDTLRADRVTGTASPAQAWQGLAREGTAFLDASAQIPLTLPSHVSIFTGRYPHAHGVRDNSGFILSSSVPTLASTLRQAGYHTAAFVSSFVLRSATGLSNGFELYDDHFEGAGRLRMTASSLERRGPEVARLAAAWLRTAPEPFFLWVHFYDPHASYDPPPACREISRAAL